LKSRDEIGVENIMWATDFPHMNCDWPESRKIIDEQMADIPPDEARRIVCGNAIDFFQLQTA
jgi:predicted TIM-barrel fold metal-dependent hydrolase